MRLKDWVEEEKKRVARLPKILYCITFEVFKNGKWIPREEYTHAYDQASARLTWAEGVPRGYKLGFNVHLVGIAPAIGVHEDQDTGQQIVG